MKTILGVVIFFSWPLWAQTFVGTFVAVKGDVKILRTPAGDADKGPFALYEGTKYAYENAKIGKKIKPLEIVQSGADGKAKIVYPNGDHFLIGVGTTMVMPDISENSTAKPSIKLLYGRIRALVSKTGPRNNISVRTPSAVAGVRGTDFFTRSNPSVGTQITVLRGEVAVQATDKPEKVVEVKTGYSTEVKSKTQTPTEAIEATREELIALQGESSVKASKEEIASLTPEVKKTVAALSEKTKEAVLNDIKIENENLYKELKEKKAKDVEDINTAVVANLYKQAPSGAKKKKPTQEEIDSIGKDVYETYFNKKQEAD